MKVEKNGRQRDWKIRRWRREGVGRVDEGKDGEQERKKDVWNGSGKGGGKGVDWMEYGRKAIGKEVEKKGKGKEKKRRGR